MKILEKKERRLGERLHLKGERCLGAKCAAVRRNYPPGIQGKSKRRRASSEYSNLMREKQKVRFMYGLDAKDVARYSKEAVSKPGIFSQLFMRLVEGRLDNVVFRLGFADSRRIARQMVSHGHIAVDGKNLNIPSSRVKKGQVVSIKEKSLSSPLFSNLGAKLKKYEAPKWLNLEKDKRSGKVISLPEIDEGEVVADVMKIKEFYSR